MATAKAVRGTTSRLTTLKKRAEFLRVRKGLRYATPAFVLEAKARPDDIRAAQLQEPRFGFTVTKQIGPAVERNRIRRRLRAAVRDVGPQHARNEFDYVLIARRPALTSTFETLVAQLANALARMHRAPSPAR
jgi:ribonuclease P protein component